ncbi:hypothetical protein ACOMHN_031572 [Nucella lapillus]
MMILITSRGTRDIPQTSQETRQATGRQTYEPAPPVGRQATAPKRFPEPCKNFTGLQRDLPRNIPRRSRERESNEGGRQWSLRS